MNSPLILPTAIGAAFALVGVIINLFPPKKINHFYGYRTKRSMKSQENWDYAQKHASMEMIKFGIINFFIGFMGGYFDFSEIQSVILGLALLLASVGLLIFRVERALKSFE